ncbi:Zn-dependent hydrolase [Alkalihalobacillus sp. MEB130]|uniref:Zn-dependent hydrolase n=1 Tax=Alkalihalobacillus sp. MEB130 TaxID=2976704 RepID=UPI0028DE8BBE|nr:Zn-dependent hydrolase [Alkalihalobacillus sp. MEB130]MDT8859767.1 Zn-dependent hydrolase [Alkalihalobacillus sp. MEB130]
MQKQKLLVNGERLKNELETFADFGRTANNGVTRLALSEEDRLARNYFCSCCEKLGMVVKVDDMGSIYATLPGLEDKPPIVIGSHLDTVKKGGRFDGVLGVLAGLEVVRTLVDHNITPRIPITIVNVTNEEGARFEPSMMASGVLSGKFDKAEMLKKVDRDGTTFESALYASGYAGDIQNRLKEATAFLELHIEQGPILESEGLAIGVVEAVMGMVCYEIEITGESDHAGTTPMLMRKDALFDMNDFIYDIRKKLDQLDSELVYTVGRVNVKPNIHTVIPNKVIFSLEARHKDAKVLTEVERHIADQANVVIQQGNCEVKLTKMWSRDTVWFDEELVQLLEESTKILGYSYKKMISGAGHDAQFINTIAPSVMLFAPSKSGKSHCEEEETSWEECEQGANVLLESVLTLLKD